VVKSDRKILAIVREVYYTILTKDRFLQILKGF